jgi:hypothetical protein
MAKAERPMHPASAEAPPGPGAGAGTAPSEPAAAKQREDMVFIHSPSESGEGYRVIRKREDQIEVGEIRPVEEGRPLHGDVVRLRPREEHDRLFDVEVLVEAPRELRRSGPAQVATDAYRSNWDAIFGQRDGSGALN